MLLSIVMMIFTSIYGVVDGFFVSNYVGSDGIRVAAATGSGTRRNLDCYRSGRGTGAYGDGNLLSGE